MLPDAVVSLAVDDLVESQRSELPAFFALSAEVSANDERCCCGY